MPKPFHVEIYQGRSLLSPRQKWRWTAIKTRGGRKLANGGEAYVNKLDMLETVWGLFGDDVLILERGAQVPRAAFKRGVSITDRAPKDDTQ